MAHVYVVHGTNTGKHFLSAIEGTWWAIRVLWWSLPASCLRLHQKLLATAGIFLWIAQCPLKLIAFSA